MRIDGARTTTTAAKRGSSLGARELEVLRLVELGLANKMIAEHLHISLNTVRNHVQSILYKLGAHTRLEAVAVAIRTGLIGRPHGVAAER